MFQLQYVATGRSVELIRYNIIFLVPCIGLFSTSGCCSHHRNFVWCR